MFTGLIENLAHVVRLEPQTGGARLWLADPVSEPVLGESVAVNGVCLTVSAMEGNEVAFDLSSETLRCTTLGEMGAGDRVNIERALRLGDRLGGHLVSGHVDAVGVLLERRAEGQGERFEFALPETIAPLVAAKGSICVDGVSLTVNTTSRSSFAVMLIPHTMAHTTLGDLEAGRRVNLEADLIARYVLRAGEFA